MLLSLIVIVAVSCAHVHANWFYDRVASIGAAAAGFDSGDTCGFTRDDALECIKTHVDENHDGKISCEEFERAKDLFMPPRLKTAMWIAKKFGYDVHFDQVLYGKSLYGFFVCVIYLSLICRVRCQQGLYLYRSRLANVREALSSIQSRPLQIENCM